MTKPTHIALMASLIIGTTFISACSKEDSTSSNEPTKPAESTVKVVEKVEPKIEIPVAVVEITPEMAGKKIFTRCKACHTINEGGRNRVGPNLFGVFGRKSGVTEGFAYSKAMVAADITWTDETMSAYLAKPRTYIPKNKMSFIGLKKETDRNNLIAYLRANTGG